MGKSLIIAEKPNLAITIQKALYYENWNRYNGYAESENYICTNCYGNLFELFDLDDYFNREKSKWILDDIPYVPNCYKYKIKNDGGIKNQLNIIENLVSRKDVETIINAGDADSEGSKLVNIVIKYCLNKNKLNKNQKSIKRLWFTDQSEPSIRNDIKDLKDNSDYDNYANEAIARERIDWLIGVMYSRALSLLASSDKNKIKLIQGRVLGSIVKFIYDRYREQKEFISEDYFNIGLVLNDYDKTTIILKDSIFRDNEQYKALEVMNELNRSNTFVSSIERVIKNKYPHNLFSLTTLQNTINKLYKMSNKEVLSIGQKLYEKGYITYPRTSSEYLPSNAKQQVHNVLEQFKKSYSNLIFKDTKHIFDDTKIDSHYAIIPTVKCPGDDLSKDEKVVYEIIKNRFLSNFYSEECIIEEATLTISNSSNNYKAIMKGLKVIKKGFLIFDDTITTKDIPDFSEGERINGKYIINECKTKAPSNITPTELNNFLESPYGKEDETIEERYRKLLEGLEIGTVATRASIIENAIKYQYITESKGVYKMTPKGVYFIETADKLGLLMSKEENAIIGKYIKSVFNNKITVDQCVGIIEKEITSKVSKAKTLKVDEFIQEKEVEVIGKCPVCGRNILESNKYFYCEGFKFDKSCGFLINKNDIFLTSKGKSVNKSIAKSLLKNGLAKVTGLKKKNGDIYDAYIKIIKNGNYYNVTFADKNDIPMNDFGVCPRCGKKILEGTKSFYCEGYRSEPKCSYTVWKINKFLEEYSIKLTKGNIKNLIAGKKVLIKDIKSPKNKGTFNANIYLDDTGTYVNYRMELPK